MIYNIRLYPLVDEGHIDKTVEADSYDEAYRKASDIISRSRRIYDNDALAAPELGITSFNFEQQAYLLDWANMEICGAMTVEEAEDGWEKVKSFLAQLCDIGIIKNSEKWAFHNYIMEWVKGFTGEDRND